MKEFKKLEKIGYLGITLRDLFDQFSSEFNSTSLEEKCRKIENLILKGINLELLIKEYLEQYRKSSKPYVAKDINWALVRLIDFKSKHDLPISYENSMGLLIFLFCKVFKGEPISKLDHKKVQYENLVRERKSYEYKTDKIVNPSSLDLKYDDHFNAWAYWHANLDAEFIIIGQDFGSVDYYKKYGGRDQTMNETNLNLRNLCLLLDIDLGTPDEPNDASVFLTNAVLGAKKGGMSAPINTSWYTSTQGYTKRLIEIIEPKFIITLGAIPFDIIKRIYKLDNKNLREAIDSNPILIENGINLFAFYHCSNLGYANRNKVLQQNDWLNIKNHL